MVRVECVDADEAGPARIRFDVSAGMLEMTFGGEPFEKADFDDLYNSLFAGGSDPALLARRQLALGISNALALSPRVITMTVLPSACSRRISPLAEARRSLSNHLGLPTRTFRSEIAASTPKPP